MDKKHNLRQLILERTAQKIAIGHFNFPDSVFLRGIFEAARELKVPILVGTAEGERQFIGPRQAVALVRSLREEYDFPIFLNADHTHSIEKVKEAVEAGYDSITFDAGRLDFKENMKLTKEAVDYIRSVDKRIVVEGEIGFIGSSSEVLKEIPAGAAIREKDLTTPEEAAEFVEKTGVDLLAPAVGNLHGVFANADKPRLDIERIKNIHKAAGVPLVLHGGSSTKREDYIAAIHAGVGIVHVNTDVRVIWRRGLESALSKNPGEVAPYKIYAGVTSDIREVVSDRLRIFSNFY